MGLPCRALQVRERYELDSPERGSVAVGYRATLRMVPVGSATEALSVADCGIRVHLLGQSCAPVESHLQTRVVCVRRLVLLILASPGGQRSQRHCEKESKQDESCEDSSHRRLWHLTGSSQSCGQTRCRQREKLSLATKRRDQQHSLHSDSRLR